MRRVKPKVRWLVRDFAVAGSEVSWSIADFTDAGPKSLQLFSSAPKQPFFHRRPRREVRLRLQA